jgi:N-acetylglucosaminyldiphosphoundecaprenol N-acetyl-beta-D-mannosaminyltransferase
VKVPARQWLLDVPVDPVTLPEILTLTRCWLDQPGDLRHVVTVNPEFVMAARRDRRFRRALAGSALATADGVGIVLAARLLRLPVQTRVTGVELVEGWASLQHPNARLFLLGAGEGVAEAAAEELRRRFPHINVVGTYAGTSAPDGLDEIMGRMAPARPTILLVAFGHPRQDLWIAAHRERLGRHGILVAAGVGGTFDYLSGRVPRAPALIRRLGFEWLYRLIRQPWRWRRQLALPLFVALVLREWVRGLRRPGSIG